jgi:cardiolipin synthase (CMP-forming)
MVALAILFLAAVTDAFDGALARHLHLDTSTGAYLDPIADKLLLSAVYISLAITGAIPIWLVGLVFGRDLLILSGSSIVMLRTGRRHFPPSIWGKASTFFQIIYGLLVLVNNTASWPLLTASAESLLWIVAVLTAWSGIHYTARTLRWLTN